MGLLLTADTGAELSHFTLRGHRHTSADTGIEPESTFKMFMKECQLTGFQHRLPWRQKLAFWYHLKMLLLTVENMWRERSLKRYRFKNISSLSPVQIFQQSFPLLFPPTSNLNLASRLASPHCIHLLH